MKYVIFLFVVILAVVRFSVKFENGIYKLKVTIFPVVPDRLAYIGWIVILGFCLFDLVSGAKPQTQMEQIAKMRLLFLSFFNRLSISLQDAETIVSRSLWTKSLRSGKNYYIPFAASN